LPHCVTRWDAADQQTQHWITAGCFAAIVEDVRLIMRLDQERNTQPSAIISARQTLQNTPESSQWSSYDGHNRKM
jgi:hypothetical protein